MIVTFVLLSAPLYAQDELVILSPHWEGIREEFERAFTAKHKVDTGRDVDIRWLDVGGTSDILRFIRSEFDNKPDGIGVDIFFGGGTDPYVELKKHGFLQSCDVNPRILNRIAPSIGGVPLYDTDGTWYAATMAGFGIIYNKLVLKKLGLAAPQTWADLAAPESMTWVGTADPRKSGSVHMTYEIILQAYGWEKGWRVITAMGANARGFSAGSSQVPIDVATGEVAYGLAIDFYAWAQVRQAGPDIIGYVMPRDLTVVNGDGMAMLRGAPNPDIAQRFIEFVLSEKGQLLWILKKGEDDGPADYELGRFTVMPELYASLGDRTSVRVNPFEWKSGFVYDPERASARWSLVNDLFGAIVIDPHRFLVAARRAALRAGDPAQSPDQIFALPITEQEALQLATGSAWDDPGVRNRHIQSWSANARQAYGENPREGLLRNLPAAAALVLLIGMVIYMRRRSPGRT